MATKVTTLKNAEKTDDLLPRTELNAIFDSDGNYLDSNLKASDLNALKGGAVDELVRFTEDGAGTPIPTDADTLEGHDASYFATAESVASLNWTYVGSATGTNSITLPEGWKEAEIYCMYTDDTVRLSLKAEMFDKYTSGIITLHGGSLARSCRVQVDPSNRHVTLSAFWATTVSSSLGTISAVTSSVTLYVWAR